MLLSPHEAPAWLNERARVRWAAEPGTPSIGEIWLLTWNRAARALVLITAVHDGYVLAMPVTDDPATQTEAVLSAPLLGLDLAVWARLETGLGAFLLHRNLGPALTEEETRDLRRWGAGIDGPGSATVGSGPTEAQVQKRVLDDFSELCFIEWPGTDDRVLDIEVVSGGAPAFAKSTGLAVARVLQLWDQEVPTADERELISNLLARDPEEIFVLPEGRVIRDLGQPLVKDLVVRLAEARHIDEPSARRLTRSAFALAARTDSATARESTRLRDTLLRLLAEGDDGAADSQ
jgi:hypothetical protein